MDIMILGSGGREHALAWKISNSPLCGKLYILPGNGGTREFGANVDIDVTDFEKIREFALKRDVEMIIVGPELPLVEGIADFFAGSGIFIVGPGKSGALLEGSKAFAKSFMQTYGIPTAGYRVFDKDAIDDAIEYLKESTPPYVLKADGLAAGKGVLIIDHLSEAISEIQNMLDGKFGQASEEVVIEEYLSGLEFSVFAVTDGKEYLLLPVAKDYKRIGEGDTGLNTGGMGAVSPVPFLDAAFMNKVINRIVEPTIRGIFQEKMSYNGFVFFGLIKVSDNPYVIEYNCRLGDPETQAILPRLKNDLLEILNAVRNNDLRKYPIEILESCACTLVLASGGYPGKYEKGHTITGLDQISDSLVFHAGTKYTDDKTITNGGRVLALTSLGDQFHVALAKSTTNAHKIDFPGKYFRSDIGFDL